jgi:hypothetical protein
LTKFDERAQIVNDSHVPDGNGLHRRPKAGTGRSSEMFKQARKKAPGS